MVYLELLSKWKFKITALKTDEEKGVEGGGEHASYSIPAEKGINRVVWDLRRAPTTSVDYKFLFGAARDDDAVQGYTVAPGTYNIRLALGDAVQESTVDVEWDPINEYDARTVAEQQAFVAEAFVMIEAIFRRIDSLLNIKKQVELRKSLAEDADDETMVAATDTLLEALDAWQNSVTTPQRENGQDVLNFAPKLDAFLSNIYQQADNAVLGITQGQRDRMADLKPQWDEAMRAWDALVRDDIAAFTTSAGPALVVPSWD